MVLDPKKIDEENRKIRFLRYLVDFTLLSIQQTDLTLGEALKMVEDVKRVALGFFPEKEGAFELIYRPRFYRTIRERFGFNLTFPEQSFP